MVVDRGLWLLLRVGFDFGFGVYGFVFGDLRQVWFWVVFGCGFWVTGGFAWVGLLLLFGGGLALFGVCMFWV